MIWNVKTFPHRGGLKLHLQLGQLVGLNQTTGEVSTPWKLADIIAHLSSQTASIWLSSIVQTFNCWKKTKKNINHWKNNFNSWKKTTKILTVKKIILTVEKKQKKINYWKKRAFFLCFFLTAKKQSCHWFFVLFFLSETEKKIEKSVWEWVLRCFLKKKKEFVFLFTFLSLNEFTVRNLFLFKSINKTNSFFSFHNIIIFNFNTQPFLSN